MVKERKKSATCNLQIFYYDIYDNDKKNPNLSGKEAIQN